MNPANSYPPGSFYFQLQFGSIKTPADNAFQEASGLEAELEVEDIQEGGQPYKHRVPKAVKYDNLVLRRGYVSANSLLSKWVEATLNTDFTKPIQTYDMRLSLVNDQDVALTTWYFQEAWPVKWSMSDFKSQENALAIETLEFAYGSWYRLDQ
jgi:phage tail-like protein